MKQYAHTLEIFNKAMMNIDYSYDIYFRMAVIEEYLNKNDQIWDLYNNMQQIRYNQIKIIPIEMIDHKYKFIELINDINKFGYNFDYPILINKNGLIIDGAHRMACALYFNIDIISIDMNSEYEDIIPSEYTKKWFEENNLYECINLADIQKQKIEEKLKCINLKKS